MVNEFGFIFFIGLLIGIIACSFFGMVFEEFLFMVWVSLNISD